MPSPLTSGAATIHMQAIKNNAALGWNFYKGLATQQASAAGRQRSDAETRRQRREALTA